MTGIISLIGKNHLLHVKSRVCLVPWKTDFSWKNKFSILLVTRKNFFSMKNHTFHLSSCMKRGWKNCLQLEKARKSGDFFFSCHFGQKEKVHEKMSFYFFLKNHFCYNQTYPKWNHTSSLAIFTTCNFHWIIHKLIPLLIKVRQSEPDHTGGL